MYKYLSFIIIGIILFIIYNNIDGLTISSKNIGDRCDHINDPPNICNISTYQEYCNNPPGTNMCKCESEGSNIDRCVLQCETNSDCNVSEYCYFNKCKSINSVNDDEDYNKTDHNICASGYNDDVYVNMFANSGGLYTLGRCNRDTNCRSPNWLMSATKKKYDPEWNYCPSFPTLSNCANTHSTNLCTQQCKINLKNNYSKDLVNAGFEHINLIDLNDVIDNDIHRNIADVLISGLNIRQGVRNWRIQRFGNTDMNHITLDDYYFSKFLEKKYNSTSKIINLNNGDNKIVYINSRIFYYEKVPPYTTIRVSGIENYNSATNYSDSNNIYRDIYNMFDRQTRSGLIDTTFVTPFSLLHIDYQDFKIWRGDNRIIDNNRINDWGTRVDISELLTDKTYFEQKMHNKLFFNANNDFQNINIWIKLDGSEHYNSLGLIDIIDDDKLNNYNFNLYKKRVLNDISSDKNNIKDTRINQFFGGTHINTNNYTESHNYNVNLNNLYLYDMNNGDAIVLNTNETPHISIELQPNEWRITTESRYSYTSKPFDIINVFDKDGESIKSNDMINSSKLTNNEHFNSIYRDIKLFFREQYDKLKPLYTNAYTELVDERISINPFYHETFNIEIFKKIMDNIRFEILQLFGDTPRQTDENNRLIIDNIKILIR